MYLFILTLRNTVMSGAIWPYILFFLFLGFFFFFEVPWSEVNVFCFYCLIRNAVFFFFFEVGCVRVTRILKWFISYNEVNAESYPVGFESWLSFLHWNFLFSSSTALASDLYHSIKIFQLDCKKEKNHFDIWRFFYYYYNFALFEHF